MARARVRRRVLAWGLLALTALVGAGCGASSRASVRTFKGHWHGHTRGIDIDGRGHGREYLNVAGYKAPLVVRFRIVRVYGTPSDAVARVLVTSVDGPRAILKMVHRPNLRADDDAALLLKSGVIRDGVTGTDYCAPDVDKCGL